MNDEPRLLLRGRRGSRVAVAITLAVVAALLATGWFAVSRIVDSAASAGDDERGGAELLESRLAQVRTDVGSEPPAAPGATRTDVREYTGDLDSSGAAIEWWYESEGSSAVFVDHYRSTLPSLGWTETKRGNVRGQLANFETTVSGRRYLLTVFVEPDDPLSYFVTVGPLNS